MTDLSESHNKGYISKVPNYNSLFNYFANEAFTPYLQMMIEETALPLKAFEEHFALCKVLAHNICCLIQEMFELGIKPDFWNEVESA